MLKKIFIRIYFIYEKSFIHKQSFLNLFLFIDSFLLFILKKGT